MNEYVSIPASEYRLLVEDAERGRILAEGIIRALKYTGHFTYAVVASLDEMSILNIFRAVCPEDYDLWLDEQKKLHESGKEGAPSDDGL